MAWFSHIPTFVKLALELKGLFKRGVDPEIFDDKLSDTISKSLTAYRNIDTMTDQQLRDVTTQLMKAIAAVIFAYYRGPITHDESDLRINASYMIPIMREDFTEDLLKRVRFVEKRRALDKELLAVLELKDWASRIEGLPNDFVLPVEDPNLPTGRLVLPGAPRAFINCKTQAIDDTLNPKDFPVAFCPWWNLDDVPTAGRLFFSKHIPATVRTEIVEYFKDRKELLQSFVSIPLNMPDEDKENFPTGYRHRPVAILNIQSNQVRLLGRRGKVTKPLLTRIRPLTEMLARCISRIQLLESKLEDQDVGTRTRTKLPSATE